MKKFDVDPVIEVRGARKELLEEHGGIDGLRDYMKKQRPILEAQGWKFVSADEVFAMNRAQH